MSSSDDGPSGQSPPGDDAVQSFREFREYARGNLDVEHHDAHPHAGLIQDETVRDVLTFMADNYSPPKAVVGDGPDELPRNFWETGFANRALRKYATDTATEAVREGNLTQISYMTGLPSYKSDVSGLHAINQLADWLVHSEQCKLIYLAALMGRGKTDLSLTFLEIIHDHYQRLERSVGDEVSVPTPEFAANFHVDAAAEDAHVQHFDNYDDLLEWGEQGGSDDVRWFIFDEASTELTAQSGKNAQDVAEVFAPFVKKMRKMGINMVVIGHDKGDVHVAIRSLADFVDKQGLKTASFYAGIKKREPTGHLFDVEGIPPTEWSFDTDDTAEWSWGSALDDDGEVSDEGMTEQEFRQEIAERGARLWSQTDVTQGEVAEALSDEESEEGVSVSRTMISRAANRLGIA